MWIGGFGQGKRFYTRISRMMITKEGEGPWRDSSWREILRGERFFVERDSSWREILRGERFFVDRLLRGENVFVESSPGACMLRTSSH
jgi:hypothetical protein